MDNGCKTVSLEANHISSSKTKTIISWNINDFSDVVVSCISEVNVILSFMLCLMSCESLVQNSFFETCCRTMTVCIWSFDCKT